MSHNQIEIMKTESLGIIIFIFICVSLFVYFVYRRKTYSKCKIAGNDKKQSAEPAPVDPQIELKGKITKMVAWAKTIDINAIAEKTGGSPEVVEETAGHPSSWLRFAKFIEAENTNLGEVLDFGRSLQGDAKEWFQKYVGHTFALKSLTIDMVGGLNINQRKFLFSEVFDIEEFARNILKDVHELKDYFRLVSLIETVRKLGGQERLSDMLCDKKDLILRVKHEACETMDDYVAFFRTLPSYINDCPYWKAVYRTRQKVGYHIEQTLESSIKNATSSKDLETLLIPTGIYEYDRPMSENLARQKEEKLCKLHEKELRERIQREIAGK